ncbi:hypothetical protein predicted by Glimmer/Critica [Sorangium cellulosum So ce56]|uniref:Serine protease n=2 Tax=Sorangium cellulosum TaxID=56 RepID=A9G0U1_SORC5|nr:hypothetical protein predicted by Glimmer/Critica [Sorangium cellulosum So ce56]
MPVLPRSLQCDVMHAALLEGIVRIQAGTSRGTGFVVRVQRAAVGQEAASAVDVLEILTAFHVVADIEASRDNQTLEWHGDGSATVQFRNGQEVSVTLDATTMHSVDEDWALLRFEGTAPGAIAPLALARLEPRAWRRPWSTFGYGDAQPDKGEAHSGHIELEEDKSIQLFDRQAAAGAGGLLSGFSGAPCIFEGHVIGIVIEALQRTERGESIHGSVYALPIERVVVACGLPLVAAPVPFEGEVDAALANVQGASLLSLAKALDVPVRQPEQALRLWVARALLVADPKSVCDALVSCGCIDNMPKDKPLAVAEMALARAIHEEGAQALRRCFEHGKPKGVVTVASEALTAKLMVARALGKYALMKKHLTFVESRARSHEAWSVRIRDALLGLLGFAPGDIEDDAALDEGIAEWGGVVVAFPFDGHTSPLEEIERYQKARALAMIPAEGGATFARDGYELTRVFDDADVEKTIKKASSHAARYLAPARRLE